MELMIAQDHIDESVYVRLTQRPCIYCGALFWTIRWIGRRLCDTCITHGHQGKSFLWLCGKCNEETKEL